MRSIYSDRRLVIRLCSRRTFAVLSLTCNTWHCMLAEHGIPTFGGRSVPRYRRFAAVRRRCPVLSGGVVCFGKAATDVTNQLTPPTSAARPRRARSLPVRNIVSRMSHSGGAGRGCAILKLVRFAMFRSVRHPGVVRIVSVHSDERRAAAHAHRSGARSNPVIRYSPGRGRAERPWPES